MLKTKKDTTMTKKGIDARFANLEKWIIANKDEPSFKAWLADTSPMKWMMTKEEAIEQTAFMLQGDGEKNRKEWIDKATVVVEWMLEQGRIVLVPPAKVNWQAFN